MQEGNHRYDLTKTITKRVLVTNLMTLRRGPRLAKMTTSAILAMILKKSLKTKRQSRRVELRKYPKLHFH